MPSGRSVRTVGFHERQRTGRAGGLFPGLTRGAESGVHPCVPAGAWVVSRDAGRDGEGGCVDDQGGAEERDDGRAGGAAWVARVFTASVPGPGHPCGDDAALLVSCSAAASGTAGRARSGRRSRSGPPAAWSGSTSPTAAARGVPQLRPSGDEAEGVRGLGWSGLGRTTCRRKTAISWRSTRISASLAASLRARSASQPSTRTINR
jgi:hypothetical protein